MIIRARATAIKEEIAQKCSEVASHAYSLPFSNLLASLLREVDSVHPVRLLWMEDELWVKYQRRPAKLHGRTQRSAWSRGGRGRYAKQTELQTRTSVWDMKVA